MVELLRVGTAGIVEVTAPAAGVTVTGKVAVAADLQVYPIVNFSHLF